MCVFFFSSRRRHTRCSRDWSSDVCSSDLEVLEFDKLRELLRLRTTCAPGRRAVDVLEPETNRVRLESAFALIREAREWLRGGHELGFGALADPRSEERRVGKECRSRWSPYH